MRLNGSALVVVALLAGASANGDQWTAIDAYLEADKTYHAEELGIAFLKDVTPEEKAELFRAHQAAHPDASGAASAARAIIETGGKRSIEAAEFLIEHPAHAKLPTAATDIELGYSALAAKKGPAEALEYLFEQAPDPSGSDDWTLQALKSIAENAAEPATAAGARYFAAARMIRAANARGVSSSARSEQLGQAAELAIGLSAGVADHGFILGAATDGNRRRMTLADAETELMQRLSTSIGAKVPDTKGRRLDGTDDDLSAYEGKVVLLDFWATWCGPCTIAFPDMRKMVAGFPAERFAVVAISVDEELQTVIDYQAEQALPWIQWHVGKHSQLERRLGHRRLSNLCPDRCRRRDRGEGKRHQSPGPRGQVEAVDRGCAVRVLTAGDGHAPPAP